MVLHSFRSDQLRPALKDNILSLAFSGSLCEVMKKREADPETDDGVFGSLKFNPSDQMQFQNQLPISTASVFPPPSGGC